MKRREPDLIVVYAIRKKGTEKEFVTRKTHDAVLKAAGHRYSFKDLWMEVTGPRYFFPAIEKAFPGVYEIVELEYHLANVNVKPNP